VSDPVQQSGVRRRVVLIGAAAVVVVVAVVAALVLALRSGSGDGAADGAARSAEPAAPTTTAGSSATASGPVATSSPDPAGTPAETGAPVDPDASPPTLQPVALDAEAQAGTGVTASVTSIESFTSEASGPGNLAGPALRVTVRLTNGTAADLGLDPVSVNLVYGTGNEPAAPLDDSTQRRFAGSLAPAGSASGVYVFSVPAGGQDPVTVQVGYAAGAPVMVFRGSVD
jgi:hypothetical protein